jgi:hypothetical protein
VEHVVQVQKRLHQPSKRSDLDAPGLRTVPHQPDRQDLPGGRAQAPFRPFPARARRPTGHLRALH